MLEKRLDDLAKAIDDLRAEVNDVKQTVQHVQTEVGQFGDKHDLFLTNMWQLVRWLLILIAGMFTILGGIVGVKLTLPL